MYLHGTLLLVPSFYAITGAVKGQTAEQTATQLRKEFFHASFGTCAFWTPACFLNFLFVPQHSQILVVSVLSFCHKAWLSWLSNRERHSARLEQRASGPHVRGVVVA